MLENDLLGGGLRTFPTLRGSHSCEVLVVGGGLTGLITACMAAEQGMKVMLVEAHRLGSGGSAGCMGTASADQLQAYRNAASVSTEAASSWARLSMNAVEQLSQLIARWRIACGLCSERSVHYAVTAAEAERLHSFLTLSRQLRLPVTETCDHGDCPVPVRYALEMPGQLQFDPARLFAGLTDTAVRLGVSVYEYSPVRALRRDLILTEEGSVAAQHVILTTGWPIGMQDASQLILLRQEAYLSLRLTGGMVCHAAYQHAGRRQLRLSPSAYGLEASCALGQTGTRTAQRQIESARSMVTAQLLDWSILRESVHPCVVSADGLPLIGPFRREDPRILTLTGLGRWGAAQSVLGAELLIRQIIGRPSGEAELFHPFGAYHRQSAKTARQGEARLRFAANSLRIRQPVCPHMGGRLRWNEERMLWECPCHGSAFTHRGECLTAPAMEDAVIPERHHRD